MSEEFFNSADLNEDDANGYSELKVRSLTAADCERKDLLDLLYSTDHDTSKLCGLLKAKFERLKLKTLRNGIHMYYPAVIEKSGTIVGFSVLTIEQKLIHDCQNRGRIDDIVVSSQLSDAERNEYRAILIRSLSNLAQRNGCYKISIAATRQLAAAYEPFYNIDSGNNVMLIEVAPR